MFSLEEGQEDSEVKVCIREQERPRVGTLSCVL